MTHISNLTPEERYRLTGTLDQHTIEQCLDALDFSESVSGIDTHISEAWGQFPDEDFLSPIQERITKLAKKLRGDNKAELLSILEALDNLASEVQNATDYGRAELDQTLALLKVEL